MSIRDKFNSLTKTEKDVASVAGMGKSNEDIGNWLGIKKTTVRMHLENIYDKMEVHNRVQLVKDMYDLDKYPDKE